MKKTIFTLVALLFTIGLMAQNNMSLDQIRDSWLSKNIQVSEGAEANILHLVSAFQQTWPTYSGGELMKFAAANVPYHNTDRVVDLQNGYMAYSEDDPESESDEGLEACVWNRKNGHKLMAVSLYRMTPSELVVLCFYDYDPATQTLSPEKNLANLFTPSFPGYRYRPWLPQHGKSLIVKEYFGGITIQHSYSWDGMKPTSPKVTIDQLDNCQSQFNADYFGANEHPFTQYAMFDIDHDGKPELLLQSEDGSMRAAYAITLTIQLLAGQNGSRFLSFYNNAVCHFGSCGALCLSSVYVVLNESLPKTYITEQSEWDMQKDVYGDSMYFIDWEEVSQKEGEDLVKSLGDPVEPDLKWIKLTLK